MTAEVKEVVASTAISDWIWGYIGKPPTRKEVDREMRRQIQLMRQNKLMGAVDSRRVQVVTLYPITAQDGVYTARATVADAEAKR